MTISVLFSLSLVKGPCLQVLIPLLQSGNIYSIFSTSPDKDPILPHSWTPIAIR